MLNDFFTEEFLEKYRRRAEPIGAIVGIVLLLIIIMTAVNRFESRMDALGKVSSDDGGALMLAEAYLKLTPTNTPTPDPNATEVVPTATPEPAIVEDAPPELVISGMNKSACGGCHIIPGIPGAIGVVGPDMTNIGVVAADRRPDYTAREYLYESIVDPEAFLAPECPNGACPAGIMIPALSAALTEGEVDAIVDYLLTMGSAE